MDNPDRFIALVDDLAGLGHELPHIEFKVDNWDIQNASVRWFRPSRIQPVSPRFRALRVRPILAPSPPSPLGASGTVAAGDNRLVRLNCHRHLGAGGSGESKNCGEDL
jgi:hypothetical protein